MESFLIDRIKSVGTWGERSLAERDRVISIALGLGLEPLSYPASRIPMTSMPFLAPFDVPYDNLSYTRHLTMQKYYVPPVPLPRAVDIFSRVINVPCHGDVAALSDDEIREDILAALQGEEMRASPMMKA